MKSEFAWMVEIAVVDNVLICIASPLRFDSDFIDVTGQSVEVQSLTKVTGAKK